jgi:hypothetical protein
MKLKCGFRAKIQWMGVHMLLTMDSENKMSGHEMEVDAMEEGKINDVAGEELVMEDM